MGAILELQLVKDFLEAFEDVFERDWAYTKQMLGIVEESAEQKRAAAASGLETIPIVAGDATFLSPKVDDEAEDWGNRGKLLARYRTLKNAVA